jgi:3-oxoadipate enol-lactonase
MLKMAVNGRKTAYERSGTGKAMVLVHGFPLDHTIWEEVVPILNIKADVIVPDLRGFGESEVSPVDYLLTDLAAELLAMLDEFNIQQATIVGHSMGGYIALAFAHAYPKRTLGLGLVASQARADTPERKVSRYEEAEQILSNGVGEVANVMSVKLTGVANLQIKMRELILRQSPQGLAHALKAMAGRPDLLPYLPEFDFPVAIVHGLADALVPVERAQEVRGKVKQGFLVEVEGVGHLPMIEAPKSTAGELLKLIV